MASRTPTSADEVRHQTLAAIPRWSQAALRALAAMRYAESRTAQREFLRRYGATSPERGALIDRHGRTVLAVTREEEDRKRRLLDLYLDGDTLPAGVARDRIEALVVASGPGSKRSLRPPRAVRPHRLLLRGCGTRSGRRARSRAGGSTG